MNQPIFKDLILHVSFTFSLFNMKIGYVYIKYCENPIGKNYILYKTYLNYEIRIWSIYFSNKNTQL